MAQKTFINTQGKIVARGEITRTLVDLFLSDGTRFYSTQSDDYATINLIRSLDIVKAVKSGK